MFSFDEEPNPRVVMRFSRMNSGDYDHAVPVSQPPPPPHPSVTITYQLNSIVLFYSSLNHQTSLSPFMAPSPSYTD